MWCAHHGQEHAVVVLVICIIREGCPWKRKLATNISNAKSKWINAKIALYSKANAGIFSPIQETISFHVYKHDGLQQSHILYSITLNIWYVNSITRKVSTKVIQY